MIDKPWQPVMRTGLDAQIATNLQSITEYTRMLPWGCVGSANLSGAASNTEAALSGSVTFEAPGGRKYRIWAQCGIYTGTDPGVCTLRIKTGSFTLAAQQQIVLGTASGDRAIFSAFATTPHTPNKGNITYSVTYQNCIAVDRGVDNLIIQSHMWVDDIGPA